MYKNQYKSKRLWILLAALSFAGLTSCQSYKNLHEIPTVDTHGMIRDGDKNKEDTTRIADIPWQEYIKDTKLQVLISEGIDTSVY